MSGRQGMRRIFYKCNAMVLRDSTERSEIGWMTCEVDGDNSFRLRRNRLLHAARIDVKRVRLDVDQHWPSADMLDHIHRGCEGERRCDHFVARTDSERGKRQ